MAFQIISTVEAEQDFYSTIIYLKENLSDLAANTFANNTMIKPDKIASMPNFSGAISKKYFYDSIG